MRGLAIVLFYSFALCFIWLGVELAPDMTWPHTDREMTAALMLVAGGVLKTFGHVLFLKLI